MEIRRVELCDVRERDPAFSRELDNNVLCCDNVRTTRCCETRVDCDEDNETYSPENVGVGDRGVTETHNELECSLSKEIDNDCPNVDD